MKNVYLTALIACVASSSVGFSQGTVSRLCGEHTNWKPNDDTEQFLRTAVEDEFKDYCEKKRQRYQREDNAEKASKYGFMLHFGLTKTYDFPAKQVTLPQYKQMKILGCFESAPPATCLAQAKISEEDTLQRAMTASLRENASGGSLSAALPVPQDLNTMSEASLLKYAIALSLKGAPLEEQGAVGGVPNQVKRQNTNPKVETEIDEGVYNTIGAMAQELFNDKFGPAEPEFDPSGIPGIAQDLRGYTSEQLQAVQPVDTHHAATWDFENLEKTIFKDWDQLCKKVSTDRFSAAGVPQPSKEVIKQVLDKIYPRDEV